MINLGYRYRRANNNNNNECSIKTHRSGLNLNRRRNSRPNSAGIHPRKVETVLIIAGVSYQGPIFLKVNSLTCIDLQYIKH